MGASTVGVLLASGLAVGADLNAATDESGLVAVLVGVGITAGAAAIGVGIAVGVAIGGVAIAFGAALGGGGVGISGGGVIVGAGIGARTLVGAGVTLGVSVVGEISA